MDAFWLSKLISRDSHKWNCVWKAISDLDIDKSGLLEINELESCFKDQFPYDLNGKSLVHFSREFGCQHDQNLVNYRALK